MKLTTIFKQVIYEIEQVISTESDMEKVLSRSKKVRSVLIKLLTGQENDSEKGIKELRNIVTDIKCIAYKPTTFRVVFKNGNYFDLKYSPVPLQIQYPEDFKPEDAFVVLISGKKYNITNKSEYQQALDYLNRAMKQQPVNQAAKAEEETPEEPAAEEPEETDSEEESDEEDK